MRDSLHCDRWCDPIELHRVREGPGGEPGGFTFVDGARQPVNPPTREREPTADAGLSTPERATHVLSPVETEFAESRAPPRR